MKTFTLHTINYQPKPEMAWGGICLFNSDRVDMLGFNQDLISI
jgi:hypothetical protein